MYITYALSYQPGPQEGQAYGRNYLALGLHEKGIWYSLLNVGMKWKVGNSFYNIFS